MKVGARAEVVGRLLMARGGGGGSTIGAERGGGAAVVDVSGGGGANKEGLDGATVAGGCSGAGAGRVGTNVSATGLSEAAGGGGGWAKGFDCVGGAEKAEGMEEGANGVAEGCSGAVKPEKEVDCTPKPGKPLGAGGGAGFGGRGAKIVGAARGGGDGLGAGVVAKEEDAEEGIDGVAGMSSTEPET